jgi:hypothetical protein
MEHRSRAPSFLYAAMRVLKVIEADRYINWEPLYFADALAHWSCVCVLAPCVDQVEPVIGPSVTKRWYV